MIFTIDLEIKIYVYGILIVAFKIPRIIQVLTKTGSMLLNVFIDIFSKFNNGIANAPKTLLYSGSRDGNIKVWGSQNTKLRCLSDINGHSVSFYF